MGKWCNVLETSEVTQFKTFTLGSGKRMFQVDATLPLLQVWVDYFNGRLRKRANVLTASADIENEAWVTWKSSEMVGFSSLSNFEVNTQFVAFIRQENLTWTQKFLPTFITATNQEWKVIKREDWNKDCHIVNFCFVFLFFKKTIYQTLRYIHLKIFIHCIFLKLAEELYFKVIKSQNKTWKWFKTCTNKQNIVLQIAIV